MKPKSRTPLWMDSVYKRHKGVCLLDVLRSAKQIANLRNRKTLHESDSDDEITLISWQDVCLEWLVKGMNSSERSK